MGVRSGALGEMATVAADYDRVSWSLSATDQVMNCQDLTYNPYSFTQFRCRQRPTNNGYR